MKNIQFLTTASLATGMLVIGASSAQALDLIGNIGNPFPTSFQFTTSTVDSGIGQSKAVQFTTPATPTPLFLEAFQIYLAGFDTADTPVVQIYQGSAGSPVAGTTVNLTDPNPAPLPNSDPQAGVNTVYSFEGRSPNVYQFSPNTLYTVQLSASTGAFNWVRDNTANVTPTGLATFNSYQFRANTAGSFSSSSLFNNFNITVTEQAPPATTPEPTAILGLLAVGLLGAASKANKKAN